MYIYKITNLVNGKSYIGQTLRSIDKRWIEHRSFKRGCPVLANAMKSYGKDNFKIEKLAEASSIEELNLLEIRFIKEFNSLKPNGYNLQEGGKNCKRALEVIEKIRIKLINRKFSEETIQKMSKAKKGHTHSKKTSIIGISGEKSIFFKSFKEAKKYGFQESNIHGCCNGLRKTHKGYSWYYLLDFMRLTHER